MKATRSMAIISSPAAGFGAKGAIGQEILRDVKAEDAPVKVENLLKAYLAHRTGGTEGFQDFSARYDIGALKKFAEGQVT